MTACSDCSGVSEKNPSPTAKDAQDRSRAKRRSIMVGSVAQVMPAGGGLTGSIENKSSVSKSYRTDKKKPPPEGSG
jgi:hypothetical protein